MQAGMLGSGEECHSSYRHRWRWRDLALDCCEPESSAGCGQEFQPASCELIFLVEKTSSKKVIIAGLD